MRLNKYIASAGICSRRKAEELIRHGNVKMNGKVVSNMGTQVEDCDKVEVNGKTISVQGIKKVYLALNKPLGYVTTVKDEKDRPTVLDLISDVQERVFPIGRLDYNTSGLLLLTNDGEFSQRVSHPRNEIYKTYVAFVSGKLSNEKVSQLRKGVDIGGFKTSKAFVRIIREKGNSSLVEIKIKEGKNRQVRKMFKAVGNPVQHLERKAIGDIYLGRLKEGHYRKLTREEINYLSQL